MNCVIVNTELSSLEETRRQFNGGTGDIKSVEGGMRPVCALGIDVHQEFYMVVMQEGSSNPKAPQRFAKEAFLHWAAKLVRPGAQVYAVYEACGFGFSLQRRLSALGIECYVVCPQKLDEQNKRVKTDSLDARTLCLRLDRFLQGNRAALALVRVPTEEEEQARAIHRQREQLVKVRKVLEAQGRSLLVNHAIEPVQRWWKARAFAALSVPDWIRVLLQNTQPIVLSLQKQIDQLTLQLQNAATAEPPRGLGKMTSVIIDREIGNWHRFNNRRQIASYTGLCPSEYSSGQKRLQRCVTKHGNPRLRAALVELAWRMIRFQSHYHAVRKWNERLRKGQLTTGAARKKAIVALARQLAVDLWRIRTGRLTADQLGLTI
jgi:transposase